VELDLDGLVLPDRVERADDTDSARSAQFVVERSNAGSVTRSEIRCGGLCSLR
jgi:hypothetical protein